MRIIKAMGAALLLVSTLLFCACNDEDIEKNFSQENLTLPSWNGTVEINDLKAVLDLSIRFDVDDKCFLRWVEDEINYTASGKYRIEGGKRLIFTGFRVGFPFSFGPWTVIEFSGSKCVLKRAMESPDEKDHQTIILQKVE